MAESKTKSILFFSLLGFLAVVTMVDAALQDKEVVGLGGGWLLLLLTPSLSSSGCTTVLTVFYAALSIAASIGILECFQANVEPLEASGFFPTLAYLVSLGSLIYGWMGAIGLACIKYFFGFDFLDGSMEMQAMFVLSAVIAMVVFKILFSAVHVWQSCSNRMVGKINGILKMAYMTLLYFIAVQNIAKGSSSILVGVLTSTLIGGQYFWEFARWVRRPRVKGSSYFSAVQDAKVGDCSTKMGEQDNMGVLRWWVDDLSPSSLHRRDSDPMRSPEDVSNVSFHCTREALQNLVSSSDFKHWFDNNPHLVFFAH